MNFCYLKPKNVLFCYHSKPKVYMCYPKPKLRMVKPSVRSIARLSTASLFGARTGTVCVTCARGPSMCHHRRGVNKVWTEPQNQGAHLAQSTLQTT